MSVATVAVHERTRDRIRLLAAHERRPAGDMLAEMVESACLAAGLDVPNDAVRVEPLRGKFVVYLFGDAFLVELPRAGVQALAHSLTQVANHAGSVIDVDHGFDVSRQGSGVILKIAAFARTPGQLGGETIALRKSMAPSVARGIARDMLAGLPAESAA